MGQRCIFCSLSEICINSWVSNCSFTSVGICASIFFPSLKNDNLFLSVDWRPKSVTDPISFFVSSTHTQIFYDPFPTPQEKRVDTTSERSLSIPCERHPWSHPILGTQTPHEKDKKWKHLQGRKRNDFLGHQNNARGFQKICIFSGEKQICVT